MISAKVFYPFFGPITSFDPHLVHTAGPAVLSMNLYSRLFTWSSEGKLVGDIARDFYWEGNEFIIEIRDDIFTVDEHKIDAEDVLTSLNRILRNDTNTHGSLKLILCGPSPMPPNGCNRIFVRDNKIVLKPNKSIPEEFLVSTLATVDFAIIPKTSIDLNKADLPITDWKNTTGAYYVAENSPTGELVLKRNLRNHKSSKDQLDEIHLVPGHGKGGVESLISGKVDILPTIGMIPSSMLTRFKNNPDYTYHETEPIHLTNVVSSRHGRNSFSPEERLKLGLLIRESLLKHFKSDGKPISEFFPIFSEGSLSEEQKNELSLTRKNVMKTNISRKATFGVYPSRLKEYKKALEGIDDIQVVPTQGNPPWLEPEENQPDFYISITDSSFSEDISLLYYNFQTETFLLNPYGTDWLTDYLETPEKSVRLDKLKRLHLEVLLQGNVIPVSASAYISVARKPFVLKYPRFFGGDPLWKVTTD